MRSETKCRSGFIFRPATPASLPSDEAGIYQPSRSKVGGKFNEAGIYQPSRSKVGGKFNNAHDLNTARDSSQEESIKRQLRERFANSKMLVILIGEKTKFLTKFVKWEMEVALRLDLPIIGVNLNGCRTLDARCPATIKSDLAIYVPFGAKIVEYAMKNWPDAHRSYRQGGKVGPYRYKDQLYISLGL